VLRYSIIKLITTIRQFKNNYPIVRFISESVVLMRNNDKILHEISQSYFWYGMFPFGDMLRAKECHIDFIVF